MKKPTAKEKKTKKAEAYRRWYLKNGAKYYGLKSGVTAKRKKAS